MSVPCQPAVSPLSPRPLDKPTLHPDRITGEEPRPDPEPMTAKLQTFAKFPVTRRELLKTG